MNLKDYIVTAFDTPMIDYIFPSERVINELIKQGGKNAKKIEEQWNKINEFANDNGYKAGDKISMSGDLEGKLLTILNEANEIFKELGLDLRERGGTGANKLNTFVPLNNCKAVLVGCVGPNTVNSKFVTDGLEKNQVKLSNSGKTLLSTRKGLIVTLKNKSDRTVFSFSYNAPSIYQDLDFLKSQIDRSNGVFIESALINMAGSNDAGRKSSFSEVLEYCKEKGVDIFFSPPTKQELANKKNFQAVFNKAFRYANTVAMNEKEAIWATADPGFKGDVNLPDDFNFGGGIDEVPDEKLKSALKAIHAKVKAEPQSANGKPKVVFVSVGKAGSFAITENQIIFKEAKKVIQVENTIGAGDAFAAGATAKYVQQINSGEELNLEEMLITGNNIAAAVVQQKGAQLSSKVVVAAAEDKVPTKGLLDRVTSAVQKFISGVKDTIFR